MVEGGTLTNCGEKKQGHFSKGRPLKGNGLYLDDIPLCSSDELPTCTGTNRVVGKEEVTGALPKGASPSAEVHSAPATLGPRENGLIATYPEGALTPRATVQPSASPPGEVTSPGDVWQRLKTFRLSLYLVD